ncbi:MAG: hypothetical protein KBB94_00440 [Legionellaceae bacterium]|nr:hypothetical protein [Legionellaceae bacterium]
MRNILLALGLSGLLSPLLLILGGCLKIAPGPRFKICIGIVLLIWCQLCHFRFNCIWLEGILCISAVLLIGFMVWSVLCWGYTLSMLLCLQTIDRVENIDQWEIQYAGPQGLDALSLNRANVLVWLRFARVTENQVILTKLGLISASILQIVSRFFGVRP